MGQPLDEAHVHRSELVAALSEQPLGSPVTAKTLARVLSHPEGGARQCPNGARLVPILNRIDTDADMPEAREAAETMLATESVCTVLLGCVRQNPPVREAWAHTAGIVLAAGQATRFGRAKQALHGTAQPWRPTAARTALAAGLNPVIVVLGYQAEMIEKSRADLPVQPVFNADFEAGQSTSLRKGLDALPSRHRAQALFLLADQPLITTRYPEGDRPNPQTSFAPACVPVLKGAAATRPF